MESQIPVVLTFGKDLLNPLKPVHVGEDRFPHPTQRLTGLFWCFGSPPKESRPLRLEVESILSSSNIHLAYHNYGWKDPMD